MELSRICGKSASVLLVIMLAAVCAFFAGCSSGSASSSAAASSEAAVEESIITVGEQTDTALNLVFTNAIGVEITDIAVVPAGSEDAPSFAMALEDRIGTDGKVSIFAEPVGEQTLFDVYVMCGEVKYVLHDVNFEMLEQANIHVQDGIAFIEAQVDGNVLTSFQDEADRAAAELAAQAAPEAEPEPEAEDPVPYYAYSAPAQTQDQCVGDVVLR